MTQDKKPRKFLFILVEKERDRKALDKLRQYGRLLKKKHNRKKRQKVLNELKEIAKKLSDPILR